MIKALIVSCTMFLGILVYSQTKIKDYPEGIYDSFENFSQKIPSKTNYQLTVKTHIGKITDYKFYDEKNKRVKNVFAIVYEGNLYISPKKIKSVFTAEGKDFGPERANNFLKIQEQGKFLYAEVIYGSISAAFSSGLLGGGIGGLIMYPVICKPRGIIYLEEDNSFFLIRNPKRFKKFISEKYPDFELQKIQKKENEKNIELYKRILNEI